MTNNGRWVDEETGEVRTFKRKGSYPQRYFRNNLEARDYSKIIKNRNKILKAKKTASNRNSVNKASKKNNESSGLSPLGFLFLLLVIFILGKCGIL